MDETFGQALRRLRGTRSLRRVAELAYCSKSHVFDLESGRRKPTQNIAAALDKSLDAKGELIAFTVNHSISQEHAAPKEEATLRREFTALLGKTVASMQQVSCDASSERVIASQGRRTVDRQLALAHHDVARSLAGLYRSADPRSTLPVAMSYADQLLELLDASMSDAERVELSTAAVGIHAQVGLWACHMRKSSLAYRYLATACEVAAGTENRPLRARALGALSYLFSSAPRGGQGGNPRRALELLDEAHHLASHADGFTKGWLATWRADQHATLGALEPARADIEAADSGLNSPDTGCDYGFFARRTYGYGMEAHPNSVRAVTFALAGEVDESEGTFNRVQESAVNMRRRVASYGHLAMVQSIALKNPEASCDALSRSADLAIEEHYTMGLQRVLGVRSGFDQRWKNFRCVRAVDDQLRQLPI